MFSLNCIFRIGGKLSFLSCDSYTSFIYLPYIFLQVSSQNPRQDFLTELKLYLAEPNIVRSECPIQYWGGKEAKFHLLRHLSRKYLIVPATSVPSERVFSKAGELISKRRSRLHPKQVQMTLFLNSNIAYF